MHMKHYAAMLLAGISVIAFQGSSRAANEPALKGEVRSAEPFFAVIAALGKTDLFRTHEVPRIKAVLETMKVW